MLQDEQVVRPMRGARGDKGQTCVRDMFERRQRKEEPRGDERGERDEWCSLRVEEAEGHVTLEYFF